jgi:hypothetical protein
VVQENLQEWENWEINRERVRRCARFQTIVTLRKGS